MKLIWCTFNRYQKQA